MNSVVIMNQVELNDCFKFVHLLALKCGDLLLEGFKDCGEVRNKGLNHDLVTYYDGKIEELLIDGIKGQYPDHKFIAEESASVTGAKQVLTTTPTWIIDPIDGTINFVRKLDFVCISIALAVDKDLKIAILYNPCLNEMYTAIKGGGAYRNGSRIYASKVTEMKCALIAHEISLASVSAFEVKYIERARAFVSRSMGIRALGSAALTLCYVARGTLDAYNIEDLKPWDIAAGALIVMEAGGTIIDKHGGPIDIMKPNIIATGTHELALIVQQLIKEIDEKFKLK